MPAMLIVILQACSHCHMWSTLLVGHPYWHITLPAVTLYSSWLCITLDMAMTVHHMHHTQCSCYLHALCASLSPRTAALQIAALQIAALLFYTVYSQYTFHLCFPVNTHELLNWFWSTAAKTIAIYLCRIPVTERRCMWLQTIAAEEESRETRPSCDPVPYILHNRLIVTDSGMLRWQVTSRVWIRTRAIAGTRLHVHLSSIHNLPLHSNILIVHQSHTLQLLESDSHNSCKLYTNQP